MNKATTEHLIEAFLADQKAELTRLQTEIQQVDTEITENQIRVVRALRSRRTQLGEDIADVYRIIEGAEVFQDYAKERSGED